MKLNTNNNTYKGGRMNTVTLKASEIAELEWDAQEHGAVALAKMIGISKTQLYRILRGHNRVKTETADRIKAWQNIDIPQPEKRHSETREEVISLENPDAYIDAILRLVEDVIRNNRGSVTISFGGNCKCGD